MFSYFLAALSAQMARYVPEKLSCANSQLFRKRSINPTDLGADGLRLEKTDSQLHLPKHFLEQLKLVREVFGHGIHAPDHTESGHESRRRNLMKSIAPEIKAVEYPVGFLDSEDNRLVGDIGRCFEALGL